MTVRAGNEIVAAQARQAAGAAPLRRRAAAARAT